MAAVTICSDFRAQNIKSLAVSIVSPSICHEVLVLDAMILVYWMLSFKPAFSYHSSTFIKQLFSYSSLSAFRVVSSSYLKLLFLPAILIPARASSSPAFCMMYSAHKLNKLKQPCLTQWNYEPCHVGPPKTTVTVVSSDKMWSTGEENGKPLQYSCLQNPISSMKNTY